MGGSDPKPFDVAESSPLRVLTSYGVNPAAATKSASCGNT